MAPICHALELTGKMISNVPSDSGGASANGIYFSVNCHTRRDVSPYWQYILNVGITIAAVMPNLLLAYQFSLHAAMTTCQQSLLPDGRSPRRHAFAKHIQYSSVHQCQIDLHEEVRNFDERIFS